MRHTAKQLLARPARAEPFLMASLFRGDRYPGFDFTELDHTKLYTTDATPLLWLDGVGDPVTVSGQQVQNILDKSQGFPWGPELIVGGDFASGAGWSLDTGWSIAGGVASHVASASAGDLIGNALGNGVGETYRGELIASAVSAGTVSFKAPFQSSGQPAAANGPYRKVGVSTVAGQAARVLATAAFVGNIDNFSLRRIGGNSAFQSGNSNRPIYTISGAQRHLLFDGIDDSLQTGLLPGSSMTLAACFRASGASQNIIGSTGAANANRCYLATDSGGLIGAGWGTDTPSVIHGGASIAGADVVALLRADATRIELWLNGALVYAAAPNGSPLNGFGLALGGRSVAGVLGSFLNGRIYRACAVQRFVPDAYVVPLQRLLGDGVVSI